MEPEKGYFAFISYSHKDEKQAKWLHKRLEHYRLPTNLNGRDDLPKRIHPVFRDYNELKAGNLSEQIYDALRRSKYLIVICSPKAAQSEYVGKEIEYFKSLGRTDKIIPYILDGKPFDDDPAIECFPKAIKELRGTPEEILGADIQEGGRNIAAIRVIAKMFDLAFDTLYQRFAREKRRNRIILTTILTLLFLLIVGVATYIYSQNRSLRQMQSRVIAEKAMQLIKEGDSYTARILAMNALDITYTIEAEAALRSAWNNNYTNLKGHTSSVRSAVFSPDGKKIVSASYDETIKIWDAESGKCLKTLEGDMYFVHSAAFSPDGKKIVSASSDETIKIWDAKSGKCLKTLEGDMYFVYSAAFSPDGKKIVSASYDGTIKIWDAKSGKCLKTLEGDMYFVYSAAFSPDGKKIVSASYDGTIKIWDAKSGKCLKTLEGDMYFVYSAAFSPDGKKIVSASYDGTIKIWDAKSGKCLKTLEGDMYFVYSAAFSPDGKKIVSASYDGTIRIWDAKSGKCLKTLKGHTNTVYSAAFSPDGKKIASASSDTTIRIWDMESNRSLTTIIENIPITEQISRFSPDSKKFLSVSPSETVEIYDTESGKCSDAITGLQNIITLDINPNNNRIAIAYNDGSILLYEYDTIYKCIDTLHGCKSSFLLFSPDGKYLMNISMSDKTTQIWNIQNRKCTTYKGRIFRVSHDWKKAVRIYNHRNGKKVLGIGTIMSSKPLYACKKDAEYIPASIVNSLSFTPDDKLLVVCTKNHIEIYDATNGEYLSSTLRTYYNSVSNKYLAISNKYKTSIYDIRNCKLLITLSGISNAKLSPDGTKLFGKQDGVYKLWKFPSLEELVERTRKQFRNRELTEEEKKTYYLTN